MKLIEHIHLLTRLDNLIRRKATGTPKDLSNKLGVSERHAYRLINDLKNIGFPIAYNRIQDSYCYNGQVSLQFSILINGDNIINIKNGN